jgi:hypothetical protein
MSASSSSPPSPADHPAYKEFLARKEKFAELRVDLAMVALGGQPNQDGFANKWKIAGCGNITVDGQRWYNLNIEKGGVGALSLVEHALGERPGKAARWLDANFGDGNPEDWKASAASLGAQIHQVKKEFQPPERFVDGTEDVRNYLVEERFLPPSLINSEIERGSIYATRKILPDGRMYGRPRCVFISSSAAEIRSIETGGFKGCCPGSNTKKSGYRISFAKGQNEQVLALTEAAVDALSYRALFPGRFVISTNGSGRFDLQYALTAEALDNGYGVRAAFDADWAGDKAAQKLFNAVFVRKMLSRSLSVEPETVDEWLLEKAISIEIDNSPHHMFFNDSWKAELPVFARQDEGRASSKTTIAPSRPSAHIDEDERKMLEDHEDESYSSVWTPTGRVSPPAIRLIIEKSVHHKLPVKRDGHDIVVSEEAFRFIQEKMRLRRDRPPQRKDWNDELRQLGSSYLRSYEKLAAEDFPSLPQLPPSLAEMREPLIHRRPSGP